MFSHLASMSVEMFYLVASALFAPLCLWIGFSMNIVGVYDSFINRATPVLFRGLGIVLGVLCVGQVLRVGQLLLS
jgi:hypothetical protein